MNTRLMIERTKANQAGDCHVYVEVSIVKDGRKKTVRIPTNVKVNANSWSAKSQAVIRGKSADFYKVNQSLITEKEVVNNIIAELQQRGRFELHEIKRAYIERTQPIIYTFFQQLDDFITRREQKMTRNGVKDYRTLKSHLKQFEEYRKNKIIVSEIGKQFFEDFFIFLCQTKTKVRKDGVEIKYQLSDSTVKKNLQILRLYLNGLLENGMPVNKSYKEYKIGNTKEVHLITLEEHEFRLLLKPSKSEKLERVRKMFVLQCCTGLRFSDLVKIRKSHIRNNNICLNATKTSQVIQIPLNSVAKTILEEYDYNLSELAISNQKYNDYIKNVCEELGVDSDIMRIQYQGNREIQTSCKKYKIMSSHHARRFFITQNLRNGIRPEIIMRMTGHKDFRSFKKYVAVVDQDKIDAMNIWSKKFE